MPDKTEARFISNGNKVVESATKRYALIDELSNSLRDGILTMEKINRVADGLGISTCLLSYRIILKSNLNDIFYNYCKDIGKERVTSIEEEEILQDFFEKIQRPENIEPIKAPIVPVDDPLVTTIIDGPALADEDNFLEEMKLADKIVFAKPTAEPENTEVEIILETATPKNIEPEIIPDPMDVDQKADAVIDDEKIIEPEKTTTSKPSEEKTEQQQKPERKSQKSKRERKAERKLQRPIAPDNLPVAPTTEPLKVETLHKPEKRNWWEVKRESEVMAVEDLFGSMEIFERHMGTLKVAEKDSSGHWIWKGGNKKLVFLGDILGDRGLDGIEITNTIFDLADQAEKVGGEVEMLCGNHDWTFASFLAWGLSYGDIPIDRSELIDIFETYCDQAIGVCELIRYISKDNDREHLSEIFKQNLKKEGLQYKLEFNTADEMLRFWKKLLESVPEIINKWTSSTGRNNFLENLCHMKVATSFDDSLFFHTDPTTDIVEDITKKDDIRNHINLLNQTFQFALYHRLANNNTKYSPILRKISMYFDADNRFYFTETNKEAESKKLIEKIRNFGINAIIHGHSPTTSGKKFDADGLLIIDIHSSFFDVTKGIMNDGTATINKNGKVLSNKIYFREHPYKKTARKNSS
jgi:hypothetical protein